MDPQLRSPCYRPIRGIWTLHLGLAASILVLTACSPQVPSIPGSNLVVIMIDTLRADHLGAYGYPVDTSPFIDELAKRSVLFEEAHSAAPQTAPSVLSFLSSLYPRSHGLQYYYRNQSFHPTNRGATPQVGAEVPLMAEMLRGQGYATAAVVTNPWLNAEFGFGRGFQEYVDLPSERRSETYSSATVVNTHARRILRERSSERFFLYLHYMDVHSPYDPPEEHRNLVQFKPNARLTFRNGFVNKIRPIDLDYTRSLYDAEIRGIDDRVREIFGFLEESGLADSTLVVLASDHGEAFFEHGGMGHGWNLYQELIHVPLLFWHAGLEAKAHRIAAPMSTVDVLPTVLDLLGLAPPPRSDGRSLSREILGEAVEPGAANRVVASETGTIKGIRTGAVKVIQYGEPNRKTLAFDLDRDPGEKNPLDSLPRIEPAQEQALAPTPAGSTAGRILDPEADRELREQLRALGYVE